MRTARLLEGSLAAMGRYKLRSGFIMLGTLVGAGALTLVISIGEAGERKLLTTVRQLFGGSSILLQSGGGRMRGGPRGEAARLTLDDMAAVAREVPGVEAWDPQQVMSAAPVRYGAASATARVLGQSERFARVWNRGVSRGELFDASAVAGSARVAILGETVVRELFGEEDPLGAEVLIGNVPLRVIGVLERFGIDIHGLDRDDEIVVPISTVMRRLMNVDTLRGAKLLARDPDAVEATAREVERALRQRHGLPTGQPNDFGLMTAVEVQRMVAKTRRVLFLFVPLVAVVILLAAGVVAASLMLASVNERMGEIGLRRAVGARPVDVGRQFLLETAVTTLGGGLGGVLIGSWVARLVADRFVLGEVFSWPAVLLGLAAAVVTGLLAGVVPARRAARLAPADALRS